MSAKPTISYPKWLDETIEFLWLNRKKLGESHNNGDVAFDFPDYGGLPLYYNRRLMSHQVDWIQENLPFKMFTKNEFKKAMILKFLER